MVYGWDEQMFEAAEGFGQFPALRSLDIGDQSGGAEGGLPAEYMLQHLSRATQLTRLVIVNPGPHFEEITPGEFADVIRRLTQVQELVLRGVRLRQPQQQQQ
jgi:hypothetical protein